MTIGRQVLTIMYDLLDDLLRVCLEYMCYYDECSQYGILVESMS